MFKSGYTPGSIANIISGKKGDEGTATSQLFSKPAKKLTKTTTKNSGLNAKDGVAGEKHEAVSGSSIKTSENKEKLKSLKKLAKSSKKDVDAETNTTDVAPKKDRLDRKEMREKSKKIKKSITEKNKRSIFVGNLPINVKKKDLTKLFREFGTIDTVRFRNAAPANPKMPKKGVVATGQYHDRIHSLNAFVVFTEESAAEKATKLNGFEVEDHHIRVDVLVNNKKPHDHSRSVFVGNLAFDAEDEDIRQHFEDCGEIVNVRLVRDRFTRLGKGFGYVLFAEKDSALLALKLDGEKLNGRKLRVQRSTSMAPKKTTEKDGKQHATTKKREHPDNESDVPQKRAKTGNFAARFSVETGKFKSNQKKMQKKKSKHRLEKKRKQKLANILTGTKPSGIKKTPKNETQHNKAKSQKSARKK